MIALPVNAQLHELKRTKVFVLVGIFFLIVISNSMNAQVGIMGKRFLLKTDIINGIRRPITNIELETALTRSFTLSLSYSITQTPIHGILKGTNFIDWMERASDDTWNEYLPNYNREEVLTNNYGLSDAIEVVNNQASYNPNVHITARQHLFGASMNFYRGGAISAPYGSYFQLGFKAGNQFLSGSFNVPYITVPLNSYLPIYSGYRHITFKDIRVLLLNFYLGGGKNFLLNQRIMLDLNYGTCMNFTFSDGINNSIFSSLVAHKNGANLIAFSNNENSNNYYSKQTNLNIGLYFNLKLGILLF